MMKRVHGMIKLKLSDGDSQPTVIDLDGPSGNARSLLATADTTLTNSGMPFEERQSILREMKCDDYEHLVTTFDSYFGTLFTLETNQEELIL